MKKLGMYIHIPFCKQKCYYCDFISFSEKDEEIKKYVQALIMEIQQYKKQTKQEAIIDTIYIGGGTPSYIDGELIAQILKKIKESFNIGINAEITIEVNPGTVTQEKLEQYKEAGINRLSIGLQSTDNHLLKTIGRIHTYEEFLDTYKIAQDTGFDNINVDLMLALPGQTIKDLIASLKKVIKLNPTHISIYSLILEENTSLFEMVNKKLIKLPEEEIERKMYWQTKKLLEQNNYNQYEISNFSKKGYQSKHNVNCWNQEEYIGFGVAAHSYENRIRYSNSSNIKEYIMQRQANEYGKGKIIEEKQSQIEQEKEYMMLGFRKIEGINISEFKHKFINNPLYLFQKEINKLVNQRLVVVEQNNIRLTEKGLDFANLVFEEFV